MQAATGKGSEDHLLEAKLQPPEAYEELTSEYTSEAGKGLVDFQTKSTLSQEQEDPVINHPDFPSLLNANLNEVLNGAANPKRPIPLFPLIIPLKIALRPNQIRELTMENTEFWHSTVLDLLHRFFREELRTFFVTTGFGLGIILSGMTLFPLKEKLSATYEEERFPDLEKTTRSRQITPLDPGPFPIEPS